MVKNTVEVVLIINAESAYGDPIAIPRTGGALGTAVVPAYSPTPNKATI